MNSEIQATTFYFVSDLHFGGDGDLMKCDFTDEFVHFLKMLEKQDKRTELIINGDAFGFWELTAVEGTMKLDEIVKYHQEIFEQLRRTGEKIRITLMVGNHDYDLACYREYHEKLKAFNISLYTGVSLVRDIGEKQIWIEHGQQIDDFNASPDYGNPYAQPIGYYITKQTVAGASKYSVFGTTDWLKDIRSVDVRQLPDWIISNYFYNEMNPLIRWVLFPFLILLTVTILTLVAQFLTYVGIFDVNYLLNNPLTRSLGIFGDVLRIILIVSMIFWFFIFAVSIPLFFIYRDVKSILQRMQILPETEDTPIYAPNDGYLEHARSIFALNPQVVAYIFGHTHDAFLVEENGRAILNTGTWLKLLKRIPVSFGYLPAVYYPTFRLNYYKIYEEKGKVAIEYVEIPKVAEQELSLIQRILIFNKIPEPGKFVPSKTLL
jgi:UDP-2,3-diacylglucosamine pyrophosphatase LpxH